jgi:hypothetical protein
MVFVCKVWSKLVIDLVHSIHDASKGGGRRGVKGSRRQNRFPGSGFFAESSRRKKFQREKIAESEPSEKEFGLPSVIDSTTKDAFSKQILN